MIRRIVLAAFCGMFLFNLNAVAKEWGGGSTGGGGAGGSWDNVCNVVVPCYGHNHAKKCAEISTAESGCRSGVVNCEKGYKAQGPLGEIAGIGTVYLVCVKEIDVPADLVGAPAKKTTTSTPTPAKKTSGVGAGGGNRSGGGGSSSNTDSQNCVNSGGTWKNRVCSCSGAYLKQSGDKKSCECTDGYIRDAQKACVPTDETNCKGLGESVAKWENNQCICLDMTKIYSSDTKNCVPNLKVAECGQIAGAQWTNGECKCIKPGYELKDGKECIKGAALVSSEQKESRTKITSVYKKLNAMSGDFKVSVWKNADGNFNTARLASDSIAAVVLGTTGALVTSNIVKKNQVSGGFEDISCQVGGQTVAGWGDQFNVGIQ